MDHKVALLSALCLLDQTGTSVSNSNLRHLRVVLSSFSEEILSEDTYGQLVESLKDDGYLFEKDGRLLVTREGAALMQALSERVLGRTSLDRLDKMLDDYRTLEGELSSYSEALGSKPRLVVATKADVLPEPERDALVGEISRRLASPVRVVSAVTGLGLPELLVAVARLLERQV